VESKPKPIKSWRSNIGTGEYADLALHADHVFLQVFEYADCWHRSATIAEARAGALDAVIRQFFSDAVMAALRAELQSLPGAP
jgi:hypothetical protein